MRKDLAWSVFAIAVALVMFIVVACAAEPNPDSVTEVTPVTNGSEAAPKVPPSNRKPHYDVNELPRILMVAAINPLAKNDPDVQQMLDKAIADMQVVQQDEAARFVAFQQLVKAERANDPDASAAAQKLLKEAHLKVLADVKALHEEDLAALRKKFTELQAKSGSAPETGGQPAHTAQPRTAPAQPPAEK